MVKQISDNEIYLLIKYIKSVLWGVAKRLSYIEDAWCLRIIAALENIIVYFYHHVKTINTLCGTVLIRNIPIKH